MADRAEDNKVPAQNAPNSDQDPQQSRAPDDRQAPPHRDEINRNCSWSCVSRPIIARSRRESPHSDGITDQKSPQRTFATKSALSGHARVHCKCPLLGVKRTCLFALHMSAYDPKRTLPGYPLRTHPRRGASDAPTPLPRRLLAKSSEIPFHAGHSTKPIGSRHEFR